MDPDVAYARRQEFSFVDVRQDHEWDAGHVEGAEHIPLQELPARIGELDPSRPVVAVCQVGQRSGLAADFLIERGYDAHNLEGGLARWQEEGFPLVKDEGGPGSVIDGWAATLEW